MSQKRLDLPLLDLRPTLPISTPDESTEIEHFQNTCLRPILKFQHELILSLAQSQSFFIEQLLKQPTKALLLSTALTLLQKNNSLKMRFIGCIVGLFTLDELEFYLINEKEVNKRITGMLAQRLTDTLFPVQI